VTAPKLTEATAWVERWMVPLYQGGQPWELVEGFPDKVYTPTLDYAFKIARTMWPTALGWRCLGLADGELLVDEDAIRAGRAALRGKS
jgi:hypothetical protein